MMFGSKEKKIENAIAKKKPAVAIGLLEDKDESIQLAAIAAAGKIGGDDCMNALIPLLHNGNAKVRGAAAMALGELGNGHAAAFLSYQLDHETDAQAQKEIRTAMNMIHNDN